MKHTYRNLAEGQGMRSLNQILELPLRKDSLKAILNNACSLFRIFLFIDENHSPVAGGAEDERLLAHGFLQIAIVGVNQVKMFALVVSVDLL